jgi:hypothetical protein
VHKNVEGIACAVDEGWDSFGAVESWGVVFAVEGEGLFCVH